MHFKIMKPSFNKIILLFSFYTNFAGISRGEDAYPRPAYMPSTPAASKVITSYNAADVVGAVTTISTDWPLTHPYRAANYKKGIKTLWPLAKDKTQIDAMVQFVLDAPPEETVRELYSPFDNVRFVIQEIMDITVQDKADEFVRIVNAQTDPQKKIRARAFALIMFEELLDPRLIALKMEELDDTTEYTEKHVRAEGTPRWKSSIRADAKGAILTELEFRLKMNINRTPFKTADEAANCAALKAWLTANWAQIEAKCEEAKTRPDRIIPNVSVSPWDARW
jgi:hypothetical protein